MAYSDYGGYAFRNGVRVEERSDCRIAPDGMIVSSPGCWPGWVNIGDPEKKEQEGSWPMEHVVLGDGPFYVGLYKQLNVSIYDKNKFISHIEESITSTIKDEEKKVKHFTQLTGKVDSTPQPEYIVTTVFTDEDNYYSYVKLEQPDGVIWCGFSGYGVGAGLEDADYGYSTEKRVKMLKEFFPEGFTNESDKKQ